MKPYLLVVIAMLSGSVEAQMSLGLSPMRVELPLKLGGVHSGALDLSSEASGQVRVRGELLDFHVDSTMTPQFSRNLPEEASHSCRNWLTVNPMEVELASGQHQLIRYTIRVPAGAVPGSYYCAVGYTALPPVDKLSQSGIRTTVRVVAVIYAVVGDIKTEGEVSDLQLEETPGAAGQLRVALTIRNRGDWHFRPRGEIQILGQDGRLLETAQIPSFPVLPRREQRYLLPLTKTPRNEVRSLKAEVEIDDSGIQEVTVDVSPLVAAH